MSKYQDTRAQTLDAASGPRDYEGYPQVKPTPPVLATLEETYGLQNSNLRRAGITANRLRHLRDKLQRNLGPSNDLAKDDAQPPYPNLVDLVTITGEISFILASIENVLDDLEKML